MKISVITPSFNQARFLPINLASVKAQHGVDVEHIVVDPGSVDGSLEISRSAPNVTLIDEPDRGQSDGINKGFNLSNGDILVWLNSDDYYPDENVLLTVKQCFEANPDIDIVYGDVNFVDENGEFLRKGYVNTDSDRLLASFEYQVGIVQPAVFWRRRVFEEIGGPSEEFEYCMDYELWVRMASKGYRWKHIPKVLAHHRWWEGMKTSSRRDLSLSEHFKVCDRYFGYVHWKWLDRYAEYLCSNQDGVVNHACSIEISEKNSALHRAIDEVITQEMLRKLNQSVEPEMVATRVFIQKNYPGKTRIYYGSDELEIISEFSDDADALQRIAWNVFDVSTSDRRAFVSYHVPGNFDRYFDRDWYLTQLKRSGEILNRLRSERRGDVCAIIGNGPSLRLSDLSLLANVDTIMSNFAVMSPELSRYAKILTVVNDLVAKQGALDFNKNPFIKIVPFWLGNYFNDSDNTFFVNATVKPEFGINFVESASWRSTVSFFNMQLAYAIGYRKVILIGFDHSYIQPKGIAEGVVISQKDDDENHFDPRYFKGKDWQAADTENMEKMYLVAKEAYEKDGRAIINCTVGGKLEVFRRGDLRQELSQVNTLPLEQILDQDTKAFPRLLMIDSTPIGHMSATGQLKTTLLGNWPSSCFLQVWESAGKSSALHAIELGQSIEDSQTRPLGIDTILELCRSFNPDVIYFRPIESESLFDVAQRIIHGLHKPLVIHMMDDWPERLRLDGSGKYSRLDGALRKMLSYASRRLSICDAMSDAYKSRYGGDWYALANGVDPMVYPVKDWSMRALVSQSNPFVIRYMGALADDMTFSSVMDIAEAVASLQTEIPVRFDIHTMDWCRDKVEQEVGNLPGITVSSLVDEKNYINFLSQADALVIAYNFDDKSISYTGLSLANKMPECLASATPVLAYGPPNVATITYLKNADCALVVDQRNIDKLRDAIKVLATQPDIRRMLSAKARAHVARNLTKDQAQIEFRGHISDVRDTVDKREMRFIVGPFERSQSVSIDETGCVARLYTGLLSEHVMIDVGAHHGWALEPFLDMDWKIYAFEPDEYNRTKLLKRLASHKNIGLVTLDKRCVSNKSQEGVPFYNSEQSTGISSLSAFHQSHVEAQRVDVTTLADYFYGKPMPAVDFLKIDTEGYDYFVLQGYPWDRGKPAVIECEFEDAKTVPLGYGFQDLARFLVGKGYSVYVSEWHPIIRYGIRHDWFGLKRYPCNLASPNDWGNILAFLDDPGVDAIKDAVNACVSVNNPSTHTHHSRNTYASTAAANAAQNQHIHTSTSLNSMARIMHWARLRYMNLATTVKSRSLVLFRVGQLVAWSVRIARRHPMASVGFLLVVAALVALPVFPEIWPYRTYLWVTASLVTIAGIGLVLASVAQQAFLRLIDVLRAEFTASTRAARYASDRRIAGLEARISALGQELEGKLRNEINKSVADRLSAMSEENRGPKSQLGEVTKKLTSLASQLDQNSLFQRFNRVLTPEHIDALNTTWSKRLGVQTTKPLLTYMAHRIRMTEQNAVGRLATQIEDAVLRTLVSSAATGKTLEVLEIGTLFGIGLAMIYEHNHPRYDKVHVTAIDPLVGYYGEKVPDKLLNIPVTKSTFWRNMDILGVPREDVTLIEALSTSNEAMTAAKSKQYDVLIIDGDHSYAGVKEDFQNYLGMMHHGGLIIFDDYNSADWPDVKRFVDEEVMGREDVVFVGAAWRTAVFRVV